MDLVSSEPHHMVTSFNTGHMGIFNMETQQLVLKLDSAGPPGRTAAYFSGSRTHIATHNLVLSCSESE